MRSTARLPAMTRREALLATGGIGLAAFAAVLGAARPAAAKTAKDAVAYQDEPKNGQKCVDCRWYQPAEGDGPGACKLVEGEISPEGWCGLFAKA